MSAIQKMTGTGFARGAMPSLAIGLAVTTVAVATVLSTGIWGTKVWALALAVAASFLILKFPEFALGSLMVIGSFKGAPELESIPFDLTIVILLAIYVAVGIRIYRGARLYLPKEFAFYLPILFMMVFSLMYTPNLTGGIDKTARFFLIDGAAILGPFFLLDSPARFRRFFWTMLAAGLFAALAAFDQLGGKERLTTPGGDTIQLGHDCALGIALVWFGLVPGRRVVTRVLLFGVIGILGLGMLGSGSRGPFIALCLCLLLSFLTRRTVGFSRFELAWNFLLIGGMLVVALPFIHVPEESLAYLARLINSSDTKTFLGPRAALLQLGWQLMIQHPFLGVGIDGFPILFTDVGNWPHSIPVELGSELGLIATASFCCLEFVAVRAAVKQFFEANAEWRTIRNLSICFLLMETVNMLNTGNINDNRQLWAAITLPFVLRQLRIPRTSLR